MTWHVKKLHYFYLLVICECVNNYEWIRRVILDNKWIRMGARKNTFKDDERWRVGLWLSWNDGSWILYEDWFDKYSSNWTLGIEEGLRLVKEKWLVNVNIELD